MLKYSNKNTYICIMLDEFKSILRDNGLSGRDFVSLMNGLSYGSYRSSTMKNSRVVPKWVRSFVIGYNLGRSFGGVVSSEKKSTASQ